MKFVMSQSLCPEGLEMLKGKADYLVANGEDPRNYMDMMEDADAFICRIAKIDGETIENCPNLKVIGKPGVGYDAIDVKKATELGIPVVLAPGANTRSVAEHTIAMMFSLSKALYEYQVEMEKGNWNVRDSKKAIELEGKTVGVIGYGNIGREVGKLAMALGMKVVAFDPVMTKDDIEKLGAIHCSSIDEMLPIADFLTIHVPLLPTTRDLIGKEQLIKMKKTSFIINCSRGGIVNEEALVEALKAGSIAGAGLDVFCEEPIKEGNPLLDCPNLVLSPHSAAQTKEAVIKMHLMCAEGCLAVLEGKKWPFVADKNVYNHEKWANK